ALENWTLLGNLRWRQSETTEKSAAAGTHGNFISVWLLHQQNFSKISPWRAVASPSEARNISLLTQ
ncbi:MAG: hypothetical protein K2G93_05855, partial [Rikenella sp.]|nr:hypothetical protein [Rikenella sp.]